MCGGVLFLKIFLHGTSLEALRCLAHNEEGIKEVNKKIDMHHCPINRNCLKKVTLPDYAVNFFYSFLLILCYAFVPFTEVPTKRQTFFIFFFVGGFLIHQF